MAQFACGTVLLVDRLSNEPARLFHSPKRVLTCNDLHEVRPFLDALERERKAGAYLAGFFAYEFGFAFEDKLKARFTGSGTVPLAWFGVYDAPTLLSRSEEHEWLKQAAADEAAPTIQIKQFDMSKGDYEGAFAKTQQHLAQGDIYQINLTMRAELEQTGSVAGLFDELLFQQPVGYAALMHLGDQKVLSISPELFLERKGQQLTTRPMKGTAERGRTTAEDTRIKQWLQSDEKSRAENTMILDLMRNDLSRITKAGSVRVPSHCEVEQYRSLFQMTSTTTGELVDGAELPDIIAELFPCGSITGAPKLSAMEIINDLERNPRGIYTGSIGLIEPSGDFTFNVAIRSLVVEEDGSAEVGTGSGVVFDSGASPEYDECLLKLNFLNVSHEPFTLFETMGWTPKDGYTLLERHLHRLADSAAYFGFNWNVEQAIAVLHNHADNFTSPQRVRLDLSEDGRLALTAQDMPDSHAQSWRICVADEPVHSQDRFLFHKTSRRSFYDQTRTAYASEHGCTEVIFLNELGYLTEGSFTSLFLLKGGKLLTPAHTHGLLPSVFRAGLLDYGYAEEADLTLQDLKEADVLYVGNSLRGLIPASLVCESSKAL
ncbi:Aminodeoxychorismate synthase component 1 [Pseudovibrio axinellae]|uniref:Probable branched-chain-amino-acid aminotransferase n=1 Tax=Pseudovibrio axinellae TaxID=989403 RepID=A0A161VCX8_9HYPH|nr:aminodeoxychorismate synthase component I [Pseudovibrio axinellae]KZL22094.1 Aminodeoxychorismate synthase component 1 [Pseudovibrio axinellae]SEQ55558.1 para-aminobenzoate synthetase / 4-amino-4-deoxychorismate lyase [Pseudovibrio axinellae]